jgi:endonuclease/exonuclease/phosphatase (EEP) superfamily protein YafD
MILVAVSILTTMLVVVTVLPMSRRQAWWARNGDFPRLEFTTFGLLLIAAALILLDRSKASTWVLVALNLACVAYQAWWILPFTVLYPKEVRAARDSHVDKRFRIMVANVLMSNRNAAGLLAIVADQDPDVLVAVETSLWWEEQLAVLAERYPYTMKCPLENRYGMHVYSRLRLDDPEISFLVEDKHPSMHALVALRSGKRIALHCLHPSPPSPTEHDFSKVRDAELLIVGKSVAKSRLPIIVTGDMNDVAWSATTRLFRKISGLLDPRVGRGMFNTFHAKYFFVRWPLDHLFHSQHFTLARIARLPGYGSDHFPILIELMYEPDRGEDQGGLDAEAEDREWANEKIAEKSARSSDVPTPGR